MKDKLEAALQQIGDDHLSEAAHYKKKKPLGRWLGAVAALLAVCICAGVLWRPLFGSPAAPVSPLPQTPLCTLSPANGGTPLGSHLRFAIAKPQYPAMARNPYLEQDPGDHNSWWEDQKQLHVQPTGYADSLEDYFARSTGLLLGNTGGENAVCSPLSIYMALAMLAELTDGESRQQLLTLLNAPDIGALRLQAGQVWKAHYNDDGVTTSRLGTSLWLSDQVQNNAQTAQLLASHYFASVFEGDLGSRELNDALHSWLSEQTGGLLDEYVSQIQMDPMTTLALASTVYYQVQWADKFHEASNTEAVFYGTKGERTCTFMNQSLQHGPYYWGEGFGAVGLWLEDNSIMWLFLPDEGVTPEALMADGTVMDFVAEDENTWQSKKTMVVNLSLPKFDIASQAELSDQLQALGVKDIFIPGTADFSPIQSNEDNGFVSGVKHAARVAVDEDGVTAAAFTMIFRAGSAMPPEEEIDLVFDRPFAFVIESPSGLPLFAGVVNNP